MMTPPQTIAVDWNCTLQDQTSSISAAVYRIYGQVLIPSDFDRWDPPIGEKLGLDNDSFTKWAWTDETIQRAAPPYPLARESLGLLRAAGHRIKIVTSTSCPHLVEDWMHRWQIPYDEIVCTQDKRSVPWDLLIDDNPTTLESLFMEQRRVVRFAGVPWNCHLTHIPGVSGWGLEMLGLILNAGLSG
jgi:5'(3')-deoxyribonucleotidase